MLMAQCSTVRLAGVNASTCDTLGHALQSLGEILRAFDIHNSNLEIEYLYLSRPYYLLWFNLQNNMACKHGSYILIICRQDIFYDYKEKNKEQVREERNVNLRAHPITLPSFYIFYLNISNYF